MTSVRIIEIKECWTVLGLSGDGVRTGESCGTGPRPSHVWP